MSNDYQEQLARIMAAGALPVAPDKIALDPETQQRQIVWQHQADRRRREEDRAREAAIHRQNDLIVERERERDKRLQQYALEEKAAFRDSHIQRIVEAGGTVQDGERTLTAAWDEELLRRASLRRSNSHATGAI